MHLKMLIKVNLANIDKSIKFLVNKYNHLNFKIFYPWLGKQNFSLILEWPCVSVSDFGVGKVDSLMYWHSL
jgi:hypothetical protein